MERLVICCDGTWNNLAASCPTNVVKLAQAVEPVASDSTSQLNLLRTRLGNAVV
jgi:uncharacterized protein (DUF2235 family)